MHHDRACALGRPLNPEGAEAREFLSLRIGSIERKPTRREAVAQALCHSAEIARPEKYADLVEVVRTIDRAVDAKTRKAGVGLYVRYRTFTEREHRRRINDRG